ncbi:MAG: SdpI family protein [Candidatus Kapabacteria bacterium]|nr:SdpI family protein [Candidatus Kapabacteria bacterium]
MMEDLTLFHFLPVLPGIVFVIAGFIMWKRPARSINGLYGYRSPLAKSEQRLWDAAQSTSSVLMMRLGAAQIVVSLLVGYTVANEVFPVAYLLVSTIGNYIAVRTITEYRLREVQTQPM